MRGVGHQEGRVLAEAGGHADVVDAEEAAARERDVPRLLPGKHRGGGRRAPGSAGGRASLRRLLAARSLEQGAGGREPGAGSREPGAGWVQLRL